MNNELIVKLVSNYKALIIDEIKLIILDVSDSTIRKWFKIIKITNSNIDQIDYLSVIV